MSTLVFSKQEQQNRFSSVYNARATAFTRYLSSKGVDEATAKDILHDAFLVTWSFRAELVALESIAAFWFKVLKHKMLDVFRRNKKFVEYSEKKDVRLADGPQQQADRQYIYMRIMAALYALPENLAKCYRLVEIAGVSPIEAAELLGISRKNVDVRVHRARKKLMVSLADIKFV